MKTAVLTILLAGACAPAGAPVSPEPIALEEAVPSAAVSQARGIGGIAKAIRNNPDAAGALLESHGHTQASFEAALFDIAQDPEASAAYEAALTAP